MNGMTSTTTETGTKLQVGHIGEPVRRPDGPPKVQGAFAYASDLTAAGTLWGTRSAAHMPTPESSRSTSPGL